MSATGSTVSLYLRAELLRRYFLVDSDPVEQVYLALTRNIAQANATGDQLDEPVNTTYQRAPYALGSAFWASSGYGEVYNLQPMVFGQAQETWGLVAGWALVTSLTSGLTLTVGRLSTPTPVVAGVSPVAPAGSVTVGLYD